MNIATQKKVALLSVAGIGTALCALVLWGTSSVLVYAEDLESTESAETEDGTVTPDSERKGPRPFKERLMHMRESFQDRKEDRGERREDFKSHFEERKTEMLEKRGEMKEPLGERREGMRGQFKDRAQLFLGKLEERMNAAITRLESIANRIEARAQKLEERGVDISATTEALAEAQADIDTAKALIANLSLVTEAAVNTGTATSSTDARSKFAEVRKAVEEIKMLLKSIHEHLRTAVVPLKANTAESGENSDDSTTPTE